MQWTRDYDPYRVADIVQTADGGFAITGNFFEPESLNWYPPYLARLDPEGNWLWSRQYSDSTYYPQREPEGVALMPDGGFALTGTSLNVFMFTNIFVMRVDSLGERLWTFETRSWFNSEGGHDVAVNNGIIYAAGHLWGDTCYYCMWGMRFATDGDTLGRIRYTWSDSRSLANAVAVRPDGSYLLAGWQYTPWEPQYDVYVARISASDVFQYGSVAGGTADDKAYDIQLTPDGGFVTAGFSDSFEGPGTMYVVKFDSTGQLEWQKTVGNGYLESGEIGYAIAVYPSGEMLVAGVSASTDDSGKDAYFVKLAAPMSAEGPLIPHPSSFILSAYPNPFNSTVTINYELPKPGNVEVSVFNLLGERIGLLKSGREEAGQHSVKWQPEDGSGIYFVRMEAGSKMEMRKVVYLK